jgi:hypothetical protein
MLEVAAVISVLGVLLKKALEKGAEKGTEVLIESFRKRIEHSSAEHEKPKIRKTLETLSTHPDDTEAQGKLKVYLGDALEADTHLGPDLQKWLSEARPASQSGDVSMSAHASGGSVVNQVSGSGNSIVINK